MAKVLIIDDDFDLCRLVIEDLEEKGWAVEAAHNAKDGSQLLNNFSYDVILLDWYLPDLEGLHVCRQFRQQGGSTPILFLTGKGDINHKEKGFEAGADDYLTKPFDMRELACRIRALVRRPAFIVEDDSYKGFVLNPKLRCLSFEDKKVRLSLTEFSIVQLLMHYPEQLFVAKEIFEKIWPSDTDTNDGTVRVHVHSLRKKMESAGMPELIRTIRGSGYVLEYQESE